MSAYLYDRQHYGSGECSEGLSYTSAYIASGFDSTWYDFKYAPHHYEAYEMSAGEELDIEIET